MSKSIKEEEVRPRELFEKFLELLEKDSKDFFEGATRNEIGCVACGTTGQHLYEKSGFQYKKCPDCKTIYSSPRPDRVCFEDFYSRATSMQFLATTFYEVTEESRREKLWKPKAKRIHEMLGGKFSEVVDVGGGRGVFGEEISKLGQYNVTVVEPSPFMASICEEKGLVTIRKFIENSTKSDYPSEKKAFVSFELFEHLYSPREFLNKLFAIMSEGDTFIFTTLSGLGVDIQSLGVDSNSISPPQHINFLNPYSTKYLLEDVGFRGVETTTPGQLDIDIMGNNREKMKDIFWKDFMDVADENQKALAQDLIKRLGFSSHMMVRCSK